MAYWRWPWCWLVALAAPLHAAPGPSFHDLSAGSGEARTDLGCMTLDQAGPGHDPVDLYKAARACIAAGRFDDAVPLYTLAEVDGRYDSLRVVDTTTHAAAAQARTKAMEDVILADTEAFAAAARRRMDPAALPDLCAALLKLGPPTYYPRYMIERGSRVFSGVSGDGLVPGFDREAGWRKALDSYLHCPA